MRYISQSRGSAIYPKLIGTYECELNDTLETLCARQPSLIVDIGAAEGYYAVGLALRCPTAHVDAFELDPESRALLAELSRLNSVEARVNILGECTVESLARAVAGNPAGLLICDVEGAEARLLDHPLIDSLRQWSLVVEVHDFLAPNTGEILRARFAETHAITEIAARARTVADIPRGLRHSFLDRWTLKFLAEFRPRMSWLIMTPNSHP